MKHLRQCIFLIIFLLPPCSVHAAKYSKITFTSNGKPILQFTPVYSTKQRGASSEPSKLERVKVTAIQAAPTGAENGARGHSWLSATFSGIAKLFTKTRNQQHRESLPPPESAEDEDDDMTPPDSPLLQALDTFTSLIGQSAVEITAGSPACHQTMVFPGVTAPIDIDSAGVHFTDWQSLFEGDVMQSVGQGGPLKMFLSDDLVSELNRHLSGEVLDPETSANVPLLPPTTEGSPFYQWFQLERQLHFNFVDNGGELLVQLETTSQECPVLSLPNGFQYFLTPGNSTQSSEGSPVQQPQAAFIGINPGLLAPASQ